MKKLILLVCLLATTLVAQAQFEKGKWMVNPSVTGLNLTHDTETDKTSFGINAQGGAFLVDNFALLVNAGARWNEQQGDCHVYNMGVGIRYYFEKTGIFLGTNVGLDRYDWRHGIGEDKSYCSFGLEAGYAYFLSRTVTIEPAAFWNVNDKCSRFGLKLGFGFYF